MKSKTVEGFDDVHAAQSLTYVKFALNPAGLPILM
jgi:hypothetical protein